MTASSVRRHDVLRRLARLAVLAVHLAMVLLAGTCNGLRAILTGWHELPRHRDSDLVQGARRAADGAAAPAQSRFTGAGRGAGVRLSA